MKLLKGYLQIEVAFPEKNLSEMEQRVRLTNDSKQYDFSPLGLVKTFDRLGVLGDVILYTWEAHNDAD